jgi:methylphosphotriester-DNA--protein-cysteine methyltransferase
MPLNLSTITKKELSLLLFVQLVDEEGFHAAIAYALGFEYPTYFNNYFKRITGTNPKSLRAQEV